VRADVDDARRSELDQRRPAGGRQHAGRLPRGVPGRPALRRARLEAGRARLLLAAPTAQRTLPLARRHAAHPRRPLSDYFRYDVIVT